MRADASWTYTYLSGYSVTLVGPLEVVLQPGAVINPAARADTPPSLMLWRFSSMQFVATEIVKQITVSSIVGKRESESTDSGSGLSMATLDADGNSPSMDVSPTPTLRTSASPMDRNHRGGEGYVKIENAKLPPEPVNEYGIPESLLVCLDVSHLPDKFFFANVLMFVFSFVTVSVVCHHY